MVGRSFALPEVHHRFAHGVALEAAEIELVAFVFDFGGAHGIARRLRQQLAEKSIRPW